MVHYSLILFFSVWTTLHIILHLPFYFSLLSDLSPLFNSIIECLVHAKHYSRGWKYSSLLSWNVPSCEKGEQETTEMNETIYYEYTQRANSERAVYDCGGGWRPLTSWWKMELFLSSCAVFPWSRPWCLVAWLPSQLSCTQSWSQCHILPLPPLTDLPDTDGLSFPNVLLLS